MTEKNTDESAKALTAPTPAPTADEGAKVRLAVADPWVHSFTVPGPKGDEDGTLEVTKQPKEFSAKDAERIRKAAERHGTTIKETK